MKQKKPNKNYKNLKEVINSYPNTRLQKKDEMKS